MEEKGDTNKISEVNFLASFEEHFNREDSLFIFNTNLVRWGKEYCFTDTDPKLVQTFLSVEAVLKEINAVIEQQSLDKFQQYVEKKRVNVEGREVVQTMLHLLEQCDSTTVTKVIKYTLSNFIEGKRGNCIGYAAAISFIEGSK